jgi:hypothetical protein
MHVIDKLIAFQVAFSMSLKAKAFQADYRRDDDKMRSIWYCILR